MPSPCKPWFGQAIFVVPSVFSLLFGHLEDPHQLRWYPTSLATARLKLRMKPGTVRHNHLAGLEITNHQTIFSFGEVQSDQQTHAGIQSVLLVLTREGVPGGSIEPRNNLLESALLEHA